jgi:hypothetical protein
MFSLNTVEPTLPPILFPKLDEPTSSSTIARSGWYGKENLYIVTTRIGNEVRCKIGVSGQTRQRIKDLQSSNAFPIEFYKEYGWEHFNKYAPRDTRYIARDVERAVKMKFREKTAHLHSKEWFNIKPEKLEAYTDKTMNNRLRGIKGGFMEFYKEYHRPQYSLGFAE